MASTHRAAPGPFIMSTSWISLARVALVAILAITACALAGHDAPRAHADPGRVLFAPGPEDLTSYPRVIRLEHSGAANGTLLATFEYSARTDGGIAPAFPIYRSTDGGKSWSSSPIGYVRDTVHRWGMVWQPTLFELPQQVGSLAAGTLLAAGNSFPSGTTPPHDLEVYSSVDHGVTWTYLSSCATDPTGAGIWEPELEVDSAGHLVCFFSDERHKDQGYNQLLGHVVYDPATNTWGPEVYDVAVPDNTQRPGMAVVAKMGNGRYIMSFEAVGQPHGQVHVKTSADGDNWGSSSDLGSPVQTSDGRYLGSTPYIAWDQAGGSNGEVIVSAHELELSNDTQAPESGRTLMVNYNYGQGPWFELTSPFAFQTQNFSNSGSTTCVGWSQPVLPSEDGTTLLQIGPTYLSNGQCKISFGSATAGAMPYNDDFEGGVDAGWGVASGTWSVCQTPGNTQEYCATGAGENLSVTGSTAWSDYTVEGWTVRTADDAGGIGILGRVQDASHFYQLELKRDASNNQIWDITRDNGGTWTLLKSGPFTYTANTYYRLRLAFSGNAITASVLSSGGVWQTLGSTVDSAFRSGQVGLRTWGGTTGRFDVTTVTAQPTPPSGTQLFSDDFESGSASNWTPQSGSWAVCQTPGNSQEYCAGSTSTDNLSLTGSGGWGNYRVESWTVRNADDSGGIGILGRVQDANHFYQLELKRDASNNQIWVITRDNGGVWTQLASGPFTYAANAYYRLRLDMNGSTLTAAVQPSGGVWQTLGSGTDGTFTTGAIGVRTWGGTTGRFDAVTVTQD